MKKDLVIKAILGILVLLFLALSVYVVVDYRKSSQPAPEEQSDKVEELAKNIKISEWKDCMNSLEGADTYGVVSMVNGLEKAHIDVFVKLINYFMCEVNMKPAEGKMEEFYQAAKNLKYDNVSQDPFSEKAMKWIRKRSKDLKYDIPATLDDSAFQEAYLKKEVEERKTIVDWKYNFPIYSMLKGGEGEICNNLEEVDYIQKDFLDIMAKAYDYSYDELKSLIGDYCDIFKRYEDDPALLVLEVYDFKDWPLDPVERKFQVGWKTFLAQRFSGAEKATDICYSLNDFTEREECLRINRIRSYNTKRFENASADCSVEKALIFELFCDTLTE